MNGREMLDRLRRISGAANAVGSAGSRPLWAKLVASVSVPGIVLGGGLIWLTDSAQRLDRAEFREAELRLAYERKSAQAAYLEAYRGRQQRLGSTLASLMTLLPGNSELPGLLEDIAQAATDNGLIVRSVDLKPERPVDFYVELPMEISVEGGYHQIGAFLSRMAGLERLVTLHDFDLSANAHGDGLSMYFLAKGYGRPSATERAP